MTQQWAGQTAAAAAGVEAAELVKAAEESTIAIAAKAAEAALPLA